MNKPILLGVLAWIAFSVRAGFAQTGAGSPPACPLTEFRVNYSKDTAHYLSAILYNLRLNVPFPIMIEQLRGLDQRGDLPVTGLDLPFGSYSLDEFLGHLQKLEPGLSWHIDSEALVIVDRQDAESPDPLTATLPKDLTYDGALWMHIVAINEMMPNFKMGYEDFNGVSKTRCHLVMRKGDTIQKTLTRLAISAGMDWDACVGAPVVAASPVGSSGPATPANPRGIIVISFIPRGEVYTPESLKHKILATANLPDVASILKLLGGPNGIGVHPEVIKDYDLVDNLVALIKRSNRLIGSKDEIENLQNFVMLSVMWSGDNRTREFFTAVLNDVTNRELARGQLDRLKNRETN